MQQSQKSSFIFFLSLYLSFSVLCKHFNLNVLCQRSIWAFWLDIKWNWVVYLWATGSLSNIFIYRHHSIANSLKRPSSSMVIQSIIWYPFFLGNKSICGGFVSILLKYLRTCRSFSVHFFLSVRKYLYQHSNYYVHKKTLCHR